VKASETQNHLPVRIGDYTDFYSSRSHAFNVGSIIRGPANALNENWLQIPIGYHGRASSVVVSGTPLRRPRGQVKAKDTTVPSFSECKRLDFEVEIGAFLGGTTNELGKPLRVNEAWDNVFGFVILNDWSFRDFQTWEYVPLGPFTAKNGLTTISPWIVTLEALSGA
jgi:fumarylacetoacetase